MRRGAAIAAVVVATTLLLPVPAQALPVLDQADAEELVVLLADAAEEQDICYGWEVQVQDDGGSASGLDRGTNAGVDTDLPAACTSWVVFTAYIHYTSSASESEDGARFDVRSNLAGAPTRSDLRRVGVSESSLLGSNDDMAVFNATAALPLLVAERGLAKAVPVEEQTAALPAGDKATGRPGSDWIRQNRMFLGLAAGLVVLGLAWVGLSVADVKFKVS